MSGEKTGRNVVFMVTFLATFTLLISLMPSAFLIPQLKEYESFNIPSDSWYALELGLSEGQYPIWNNGTLPYSTQFDHVYLELGSLKIDCQFYSTLRGKEVQLSRVYTTWWIFTWHDSLLLEGRFYIQRDDIFKYMRNENVSSMTMKDSKYTYHVSFAYDHSKFNSFAQAWDGTTEDNPELRIFIGMTANDADRLFAESTNAWNLINQILFFQRPSIHPILNAIIAIPIWISIAYLVVRIILWIISAPLGGGG